MVGLVGQRVAVAVGPACGTCSYCVAGHTTHCEAVLAEAMGIADDAPSHGGFATASGFPAAGVMVVPDSMADVEAALLEPAAVAFHAVRRAEIPFGAIVVVQGAGPIGLLTAQCARNAGASTIIISEPTPKRRESARAPGLGHRRRTGAARGHPLRSRPAEAPMSCSNALASHRC